MKRIYISGKITGLNISEVNQKFKDAERFLKNTYDNIEVVNPVEQVPYEVNKTWEQYMIEDIALLFECDSIFMLNNWEDSKGARIEKSIAQEMGKNIIFQS